MKLNPLFVGLLAALLASGAQAANRPSGYTTICKEGAACNVASSTKVAFGRANTFFYRQLTGAFTCSQATFGARIPGGVNECSVPLAGSSSSSSAASSSALSSSSAASSSVAKSSVASSVSSSVTSSRAASSVAVSSAAASSVASSAASSSSSSAAQCSAYTWPKYTPDLNYDMKTDSTNATVNPANFKLYLGCNASLVAGYKTSGRFAFIWGKNRNPAITDAHIDALLAHMNKDADYIHNVMGWPVDKLQQQGYFSNIYLFGSGLCTDSASNTEKGGWQSGINGYPMVLLSYYPVVTASEYNGVTHEYIHAIMASMGNKAAWFNEGSNTWLQMTMTGNRTGSRGVGFLDGAPFLAPHMPIENYSGWLQDGTFGGPNAEGVHMETASGQQIGTWREYLGGNQYNAAFSHFIALYLSQGSNAWIWKKGTQNNILASLSEGLGDAQTRRLITEYRARQAMVDFGVWTDGFKVPINDNWARTIVSEGSAGGYFKQTSHKLSFYAATTQSSTTLIPATDTLPGWSGANQIPLKVSGNKVRVNFQPLGNNMRFQLAYRAADGTAVYSQPVESGESCLDLSKAPKNGVVVGIATSTDYLYSGEATRKAKYDYRVHLLEGVSGTAPLYDKYYQ
ncbi:MULTISPECIES: hypothetical protein [unclassified Uliginosibacterium]|uniref:hypothetical protein n=1 Tax=unclassified Uliginosibacterium TaxID=2621521 RepID=UPI001C1F874F|nr:MULTISPECIES: hypothetical protein [unclassified Uliginosibacterium]MDO6386802.1 hypothetical protein [Uliginosibacterium sp. 31-12]